jgi:hypothetical protein
MLPFMVVLIGLSLEVTKNTVDVSLELRNSALRLQRRTIGASMGIEGHEDSEVLERLGIITVLAVTKIGQSPILKF